MELLLIVTAFCLTFFLNLLVVVRHITAFKNTSMFFISISLIISWLLMFSIVNTVLMLSVPDVGTVWLFKGLCLYTVLMAIFKIKEALQ